MKHLYKISGMHCDACVAKLTAALKLVPNITNVLVNLKPPQASVEMSAHVSTAALNDAVKKAGDFTLTDGGNLLPQTPSADDSQSLRPLFVIVAYLVAGVVLRAAISNNFIVHDLMTNFMGGFFVLFSLFKMIDLSGFADGYSTYDILAKRSRSYALTYPFIELLLGILYLLSWQFAVTNVATLVLMSVSAVGVLQALREKRTIQCACLGTALKLPMTKVTLVEDIGMAVMAFAMLVVG